MAALTEFNRLVGNIAGILNLVIGLLFTIATVIFLWGVIQYIAAAGNEEKFSEARSYMLYGIIALFVMTAVWGIVIMIARSFGLDYAPIQIF